MKGYLALLVGAAICIAPALGHAADCVDVNLELNPTSHPDSSGLKFMQLSAELTNCGTDPAMVQLSFQLNTSPPLVVPPISARYRVGAGQTATKSWTLPIPPSVPPGTYEVCVTATIGTATDTSCATLTVF